MIRIISIISFFFLFTAQAASDYTTFCTMLKNEQRDSKTFLEKPDPKKLITLRIFKQEEHCWVNYEDHGGSYKVMTEDLSHILLKADTFRGRDMEATINKSTNWCCYAMMKFDNKGFSTLIDKTFILKEFMSIQDYAKNFSKKVLTAARTHGNKLKGEDKKQFNQILLLYDDIIKVSFEHELTRHQIADALKPDKLASITPEKFNETIEGLQEIKESLVALNEQLNNEAKKRREDSYEQSNSYNTFSTTDFLEKLDYIDRKGWSTEKKRKAFGDLIDGRFYRK